MYPYCFVSKQSGFSFCNLTEVNGGLCSTKEDLLASVKAGSILGTLQAGYTNFKYLTDATKRIAEREALIGVSITGWMNNPEVLFDEQNMREAAEEVKKWNKIVADMIGINQAFSKYSGMKVGSTIVLSQVIGGVLSGIGGSVEVLGRYSTFLWKELPGYGWTGITVAILAKNNPWMVPLAAFFIAYLNKGCQLMATYCDVPSEMIDIIQAAIFLFFAAEQFMSGYRQKIVVKNTQADLAKAAAVAEGGDQ